MGLYDTSILIVEDELEVSLLLKNILSKDFNKIYTASNGKEALDILNQVKPDLILTDVRMPEMGGR